MATIKTILHITPFYEPNIGGVETHLHDLVQELSKKYRNIILTYSPLTTKINYLNKEVSKNITIRRFDWIGGNLFHKLGKQPILNFIYLAPYLLLRSIIWIFFLTDKPTTIHSHGIVGCFIGQIIKGVFHIPKHVVSIYSTYDNVPQNSLSLKLISALLNSTDHVLTQSNKSINQLLHIGINPQKLSRYYHWINLDTFKPIRPPKSIEFKVLFVGRMIAAKNAIIIAKIATKLRHVHFTFVGTGPEQDKIIKIANKHTNITIAGDIPYSRLNEYYQTHNLLVVPSKYEEGWGRVIAESIACNTPVICSNLGGTTEAADESVAVYCDPSYNSFYKEIKILLENPTMYSRLKKNCRAYALKHYSATNLKFITDHYLPQNTY